MNQSPKFKAVSYVTRKSKIIINESKPLGGLLQYRAKQELQQNKASNWRWNAYERIVLYIMRFVYFSRNFVYETILENVITPQTFQNIVN